MRQYTPLLLVAGLLALLVMSCTSGSSAQSGVVTIEPLASPTATIALGGKPAAPPTRAAASATATPDASASVDSGSTPDAASTPAPPPEPAAETSLRPTEGRWIEVDVTNFVVRLMDGETLVREIAPVGVGVEIDTGNYESTQTGLFRVYNKSEALAYDAPYDTYISDWVGFDPDKANGFHSFLKDRDGNVVDASAGRVSNGCIRTGAAAELYAFAEIGMPVWVHV